MKAKLLANACALSLGMVLTIPTAVSAAEQGADAMLDGTTIPSGMSATMSKPAEEFDGIEVVNQAGEDIGEVEAIVLDKTNGELHAVVQVGGFLGIGEKEVTIAVNDLNVIDDKLLAPVASTADELKTRAEYQEDLYTEVPDEQRIDVGNRSIGVDIGTMTAAQGTGALASSTTGASFGTLDTNGDGYVDRSEAATAANVIENWNALDNNGDGRLDQAEFSAFEVKGSGGTEGDGDGEGAMSHASPAS